VLRQVADKPIRSYSIGFEQSGYDELSYARISARHFGVEPREYYVRHDDVEAAIPKIASAYDEPFGNSSAAPTLLCARMASRDGTSVLLAGDGGDEIFGGNERYAKQQTFELYWSIPQFLRVKFFEPLALSPISRVPLLGKAASYIAQARVPMPMRLHTYNHLYRVGAGDVFERDYLRDIDIDQPRHLLERTWNQAPTDSLIDRMLYLDWKFTLADNDLRKVNRMCELSGVSVAYPMLDDDLVEFSTTLPPTYKVRRGTLRYFYRRALTGFLPDAVIRKAKHGFGLPFGEWLKQSPALQATAYQALEALKRRSIVRADFIDLLIREHRGGHAAYFGTSVWVLVMLEQWLAQHPPSVPAAC
jgi:asparagine synthase (glutamine-hydrolysing)